MDITESPCTNNMTSTTEDIIEDGARASPNNFSFTKLIHFKAYLVFD